MRRLKAIAKQRGEDLQTVEGSNHTKVWIGKRRNVVARHNEINEMTAKSIIRYFEKED